QSQTLHHICQENLRDAVQLRLHGNVIQHRIRQCARLRVPDEGEEAEGLSGRVIGLGFAEVELGVFLYGGGDGAIFGEGGVGGGGVEDRQFVEPACFGAVGGGGFQKCAGGLLRFDQF